MGAILLCIAALPSHGGLHECAAYAHQASRSSPAPMLPTDDCDDCTPTYLRRSLDSVSSSTVVWSSIPLVLSWIAVAALAQQRLFPRLSSDEASKSSALPQFNNNNKSSSKPAAHSSLREKLRQPSAQKFASLVFSASIGLSAVLVELLLCEISDTLNPTVRGLALQLTLGVLLVLTIVVTPALEIHGHAKTILGTPADSTSTRRTKPKLRLALELALFAAWLLTFWILPQASVLRTALHHAETDDNASGHAFSEACLERIGIVGISLMASLSGFAAVSSLWQTFGVRQRLVREQDITRKQAGLSATEEMLAAKQSRLRALQRKMSEATPSAEQTGFLGRVVGSIRGGSTETQELKALQMEVSGLETMRFTLSSGLSNLHSRYAEQQRSKTSSGKLLGVFNTVFALYCAYRICATSLSSLRRWWQPNHSFATSDPINNVLALLTTHWDSNLDRAAWSRQISFLLISQIA